jgi:hypothetical protein
MLITSVPVVIKIQIQKILVLNSMAQPCPLSRETILDRNSSSPLSIAFQFVLSLKQVFTSTSLGKVKFLLQNFLLARATVPRDIGI